MLRRLVTFVILGAFAFASPVLAAEKKASGKKAAATKSTAKKAPAKKAAAAKPAATPTPVAEVAATPAPVKKGAKKDRTFIRTSRAGWQEVVVGDKVIATKDDGSKVAGTIREVSDFAIVIEPKKTSSQVEIASNDLAQVYHDPN